MKLRILPIYSWMALIFASSCWMFSCTPDKGPGGLGPLPKASFTVTPVSGAVNQFAVTSTSTNGFAYYWNDGQGGAVTTGASDTLYYNLAGTYTVKLTVVGPGGIDSSFQTVTVANNDPGVNILNDPTLTAAGDTAWTLLNTGGSQTTFNFSASGLNLNNTTNSNTNGGVYQAVQVKAGVSYIFAATVSGQGATNSWIEFYLGTTVPTQGSDYTDTKFASMNTWSGCGTGAFSGNVVTIGCAGNGNTSNPTGRITFATSGTVYVVIKAGSSGGYLGNGGVNVTSITLNEPTP
jgi:PKD repeat protein